MVYRLWSFGIGSKIVQIDTMSDYVVVVIVCVVMTVIIGGIVGQLDVSLGKNRKPIFTFRIGAAHIHSGVVIKV